jgi:hypothetical protein
MEEEARHPTFLAIRRRGATTWIRGETTD